MDRELAEIVGRSINRIQRGDFLTRSESCECFRRILKSQSRSADCCWGAFFAAMQSRTPRVEEVLGLVDALLEYEELAFSKGKIRIYTQRPVVAVVGSGKEDFKTFNVSTASAIVAASAGIVVVKPGSSGISAITGSSDLMKTLGANSQSDFFRVALCCEEIGFGFFSYDDYVPHYAARYNGIFLHYHPLGYAAPAICIPFELDGICVGIADRNVKLGAEILQRVGFRNAVVVTGAVEGTSTYGYVQVEKYLIDIFKYVI